MEKGLLDFGERSGPTHQRAEPEEALEGGFAHGSPRARNHPSPTDLWVQEMIMCFLVPCPPSMCLCVCVGGGCVEQGVERRLEYQDKE